MTPDEIIADHDLEKIVGIKDTWACCSDNHYFDENIVREDQCHVRALVSSLPQEIFDNKRLREVEIAAMLLLEAVENGYGGERMNEVVKILKNTLGED